jgi:hypothetical protein
MAGEPIERSLLYVTELLHRVQDDYTRAISLASTMQIRSSEAALGGSELALAFYRQDLQRTTIFARRHSDDAFEDKRELT